MLDRGSFQRRIFLTVTAVAVVPAVLALVVGTLAFRQTVSVSGSAGPWAQVAESGRVLIEAVDEEARADPELERAMREHREALSASLRLSRLYSELTLRLERALPFLALGAALLLAVISLLAARWIARGLSRPLEELVGWTERIARGQPLPSPLDREEEGVREFDRLRGSLRWMAGELEASRRQEVETARLRSWTDMARRVAHELKNPLTPMRMAATSLSRKDDPATAEAASVLLEEVERLEDLARSFSRLGRIPEGPTSEVDLEELLTRLARLHGREGVEIRVEAADDLPLVEAHHDALHRALENLVVNAVEAAGDGGRTAGGVAGPEAGAPARVVLRARAEQRVAREGGNGERAAGGGPAVLIEVEDTGPGVPPELRERIWEPDFTTRTGGSGLGLPLVLQAIRHHRGRIEVTEGAAGGALFRIRLPVGGPADEGP